MIRRLDIGETLRRTLQLCRTEWRLLVGLTLLIEVPVVIGGAASIRFLDIDVSRVPDVETLSTGLLLLVWTTLAHHLLLAVVERVESAERGGHARPTVGAVIRDLPVVRLLVADLILTVGVVVGLVLLVVPGIVLAVWTAPVFPLLTMEQQPIRPTIRRSFAIVRGSAWRLFAIIVLLYFASQLAGFAAGAVLHSSPLLDSLAHFVIVLVFEPLSSAAVVVATFALVDLHDARTAPAATPAA